MSKRESHPSGRPIHRQKVGVRSIWRVPDRGYTTPRLNEPALAHPVGFTTAFLPGHQSSDDDE